MRGSLILCEVKVYAILKGRLFCIIFSSLLFVMLLMFLLYLGQWNQHFVELVNCLNNRS